MNRITHLVYTLFCLGGCEKSFIPYGVENNPDVWKPQLLEETGVGYWNFDIPEAARIANALRSAKYDAIDKPTHSVRNLMLYSGISIGDWMDMNLDVKQEIERKIRGFRVSDTRYYAEDRIEVDVILELSCLYALIYGGHETYTQVEL